MKKKDAHDTGQRSLFQFFARSTALKPVDTNSQIHDASREEGRRESTHLIDNTIAVENYSNAPSIPGGASPSPAPCKKEVEDVVQRVYEPNLLSPTSSPDNEGHAIPNECEEPPRHDPAAAEPCEGGPAPYELEREARIRRNMEVMRSLGLGAGGTLSIKMDGIPAKKKKPRPAQHKRRPPTEAPAGAVRRSARNKRDPQDPSQRGSEQSKSRWSIDPLVQETEVHEEEVLEFDDSSVKRYVCEVLLQEECNASRGGVFDIEAVESGDAIGGFTRLPGLLIDPGLARAYALDWRPGLVVAGGKDGHVSVWGSQRLEGQHNTTRDKDSTTIHSSDNTENAVDCPDELEIEPLLSQRLHRGWVSDVQFCGGSGNALRLITAGNDGLLNVWDVNQTARSAQGKHLTQCLATMAPPDVHTAGIFSMHEMGGRIVTASKDCSVAMVALDCGGGSGQLKLIRRWDDLHGGGVVKCARWRLQSGGASEEGALHAPTVFASCGNDGTVKIVDTRIACPSSVAAVLTGSMLGTAVNCVRWSPASEHLLLSASHDPDILLHDVRNPVEALHAFRGHTPAATSRIKGIYQPAFVAGGEAIASGGDRSDMLSLYRVADGGTISRGSTDLAIGATYCGEGRRHPLLCTANRCVAFYLPVWKQE